MSRKGTLCQVSTFPFYQQSAQGWLGWYVRVLLALPQQEPKMACKPIFTTPKPELQRWEGGEKNLGLKFFGLKDFNQHLLSTMSQVQDWIPEG